MLQRIRCKLASCMQDVPPACIFVPAILLLFAFIIRMFCGSARITYTFTGGIGLFPGSVLYTLGYALRLILCGIILASALFSYKVECKTKAVIFAAVLSCMMLLEYKLIFTMCRFFAAALMCLACGAAALLSIVNQRGCDRWVTIAALTFAIFETIHFIQVVSLIFCL